MADSPLFRSPGPSCRLGVADQDYARFGESPLLPGWRPPDWEPTSLPAWQASLSTDASFPGSPVARRDRSFETMGFEEEIDRFLGSLDVGSSTRSSGAAGFAVSEPPSEPRPSAGRPPSPPIKGASRLSPAEGLDQLPDEAFGDHNTPLLRCRRCGRRFAAPRLEVHEAICLSTAPVQRGVFESRRQRLDGLELLLSGAPQAMAKASSQKPNESALDAKRRADGRSKLSRRALHLASGALSGTRRREEKQDLCTPQRRPRQRAASSTPTQRPRRQSRLAQKKVEELDKVLKAPAPPACERQEKRQLQETPAAPACRPTSPKPAVETSEELVEAAEAPDSRACREEEDPDKALAAARWERLTRALCFAEELSRLEQLGEPSSSSEHEEATLSDVPVALEASIAWENLARGLEFAEEAEEPMSSLYVSDAASALTKEAEGESEAGSALPSFSVVDAHEEELANRLFNNWVQTSSTCQLPPIVAEAALLCAEVDALLGERDGHARTSDAEAVSPPLELPSFERPSYDPRKYYEPPRLSAEAPQSELGDWLKRCADKIRRRQEVRQGWEAKGTAGTLV